MLALIIALRHSLNRILLLFLAVASLVFLFLVDKSVVEAVLAAIVIFFTLATELFPRLKSIHQQAWFESLWMTLLLVFLLIGIVGLSFVRTSDAPEVDIRQFIISQSGTTTAVKTDENKPIMIASASISVKAELSVGSTEQENLMFTWYTCRQGGKPVLRDIGNPEMQYVALGKKGLDCIVVEIARGNMLLERGYFFLNVEE